MDVSNNEEYSIQIYFDDEEWSKLSTFEKTRFINMKKNYEIMMSAGLNPKVPQFMLTKKQLPKESHSKMRLETGTKLPETVVSREEVAHDYPKENGDIQCSTKKRLKKELWNKLLKMDWGYCELELTPRIKNVASFLLKKTRNNLKLLKKFLNGENIKALQKTETKPDRRYPKRKITKVCYTEEEISSEDDFLYCEDCGCEYDGHCPVHGPLILVHDRKVSPGADVNRAWDTCPPFLSVCRSGIKGAGLGVWTEIPLPKGIVFGPYEGKIVQKRKQVEGTGYAWEVRKRGRVHHYVEGSDLTESNWLRFVNCPQYEEQQNLVAFQYDGKIFYKTYKRVRPYTELLVWYGDQYASDLGIDLCEELVQEEQAEDTMYSNPTLWTTGSSPCRRTLTCAEQNGTVKYPESRSTSKRSISQCIDVNVQNSLKENRLLECQNYIETISLKWRLNIHGKTCIENDSTSFFSYDQEKRKNRVLNMSVVNKEGEGNKLYKRYECMTSDFMRLNQHKICINSEKKAQNYEEYRTTVHGKFKEHAIEVQSGQNTLNCLHCKFRTSLCHCLKKHMSIHEGHKCPHCEHMSSQSGNLKRHIMVIHDGVKPHKCPHCEYRTSQSDHLKKPIMAIHDGMKPHKCPHCEYRASQLGHLKQHIMAIHDGMKTHKCPHCEHRASRLGDLKQHMAIHDGMKPHKCPHCEYRASQLGQLKQHIMAIHDGMKPHKCPHCEYRASQLGHLKQHIMAIHDGMKPHKCPHCEHRASRLGDLKRHIMAIHDGMKPHKCPHCEYRASHLGHLKQHMAIHNGMKPHKCPHCEYRTSLLGNLKKHIMAIHDGMKPHKCPHCEHRASRLGDLKQHMAIHDGVKPHKCPHWEYRASRLGHLKQHMAIHDGMKPHKCPHCEHRASRLGYLKQHIMAIHDGMKPHKCPHCEYRTTHSGSLKKHIMAIHDGMISQKCPHCEYRASRLGDLKQHIIAIHDGIKPHKYRKV